MGAQRGRFDEEQRRRAIEAADARMWREGVAAVGDVANGESTFAVKARSAIRYRTFAELFGLQSVSTAPVDGLLRCHRLDADKIAADAFQVLTQSQEN